MSGDGCSMLHWFCYCVLSIESSLVVLYSQILHSCVLLTLVFRPQRVHRQHIVAMPSGRLCVWCKVYIHPNSTKHLFNNILTFSQTSLCTLCACAACCVTHGRPDRCNSEKWKIYFFVMKNCVALAFLSPLGMACQKTVKLKLFKSEQNLNEWLNFCDIHLHFKCHCCQRCVRFFFLTADYRWLHLCWEERRFNQQHLKYVMPCVFSKADRCVEGLMCFHGNTYGTLATQGSSLCVIW